MFDLKFHKAVKFLIDTSTGGIIVSDVTINNKKDLEKLREENEKYVLKIDEDFANWIYNRYINKQKKNKYLIGGRHTVQSYNKDMDILKF